MSEKEEEKDTLSFGSALLYTEMLLATIFFTDHYMSQCCYNNIKKVKDTLINTIYLFYLEIFCIYEHSYGCVHTQNEAESCCNVGTTSFPFEHRRYHLIFKQKASCNTPKPKHDITSVLDS